MGAEIRKEGVLTLVSGGDDLKKNFEEKPLCAAPFARSGGVHNSLSSRAAAEPLGRRLECESGGQENGGGGQTRALHFSPRLSAKPLPLSETELQLLAEGRGTPRLAPPPNPSRLSS